MNWVEALKTIHCLTVDILEPIKHTAEGEKLDAHTKDMLGTLEKVEPIEQMMRASRDDEVR